MDVDTNKSIDYAASRLGIEPSALHDEQKSILLGFLSKRDIFVGLPTGFGKSFIFQAAPLAVDYMTNTEHTDGNVNTAGTASESETTHNNSIVIIICPLTSLIKDQVSFLIEKGLKAIYFGDVSSSSSEKQPLENGQYSYIFMSPEQLLGHDGIKLIKGPAYRRHLCGIFVDESHCIAKWGVGSDKVKAFRSHYGKLQQVRSHLPGDVPLVALTATASLSVRKLIEERLNLKNPLTILRSPDKTNIRYSILRLHHGQDLQSLFGGIIKELEQSRSDMERIIVFCRSHRHCREMYSVATSGNPALKKHIAMFHSSTEESVKERVVKSFADEHGDVRLLFATIAFGMGIDVKGTYNIIHIGPPSDLDDYLQESGRAGRDGNQSHAVLVNYSGSSGRFATADIMKDYLKNESTCRRELLLKPFGYSPSDNGDRPTHSCCDVCAASCVCGGDSCSDVHGGKGDVEQILLRSCSQEKILPKTARRSITDDNIVKLWQKLLGFRGDQLTPPTDKLLTGDDIASGFPLSTVDSIMENVIYIADAAYLKDNFVLLNPQLAEHVMELILEYTSSFSHETETNSETIPASDHSDESDSSSDDSISDYRHLRLSSSSEKSDDR